jgi:hypothetical protein
MSLLCPPNGSFVVSDKASAIRSFFMWPILADSRPHAPRPMLSENPQTSTRQHPTPRNRGEYVGSTDSVARSGMPDTCRAPGAPTLAIPDIPAMLPASPFFYLPKMATRRFSRQVCGSVLFMGVEKSKAALPVMGLKRLLGGTMGTIWTKFPDKLSYARESIFIRKLRPDRPHRPPDQLERAPHQAAR